MYNLSLAADAYAKENDLNTEPKKFGWLKISIECAFCFKNKTGPGLGHIYPTVCVGLMLLQEHFLAFSF